MVIKFDKTQNDKIKKIVLYSYANKELDEIHWDSETNGGWGIDFQNYNIILSTLNTLIEFEDADSMQPYINQYYKLKQFIVEPAVEGVNENPNYARELGLLEDGEIVSHTYEDTDVEKSLQNGETY